MKDNPPCPLCYRGVADDRVDDSLGLVYHGKCLDQIGPDERGKAERRAAYERTQLDPRTLATLEDLAEWCRGGDRKRITYATDELATKVRAKLGMVIAWPVRVCREWDIATMQTVISIDCGSIHRQHRDVAFAYRDSDDVAHFGDWLERRIG